MSDNSYFPVPESRQKGHMSTMTVTLRCINGQSMTLQASGQNMGKCRLGKAVYES